MHTETLGHIASRIYRWAIGSLAGGSLAQAVVAGLPCDKQWVASQIACSSKGTCPALNRTMTDCGYSTEKIYLRNLVNAAIGPEYAIVDNGHTGRIEEASATATGSIIGKSTVCDSSPARIFNSSAPAAGMIGAEQAIAND
jgi:hypothetical protein